MYWEEIDDKSKRIVLGTIRKLTGKDECDSGSRDSGLTEEEENLVRDFLHTGLLQAEKKNREKYDYRPAFKRIRKAGRLRFIHRIAGVAACLFFMLGTGWWYWETHRQPASLPLADAGMKANQVVLTLSDGKKIALVSDDSLQLQEGKQWIRAQRGALTYQEKSGSVENEQPAYNTVTVPRGGEYRIVLADGTLVHLNAASELRYPVVFGQQKRRVYLKGEAWFEVTKDAEHPFYVMADGIRVKVYGTKFNVNTHRLQSVQTVLVEGCVGIKPENSGEEIRLEPGQLAEYDRKTLQINLKEVDVQQYTAWKEGIFYFSDETLEEIMLELGRWYGMEVFFRSNKAKELHFSGHLARYENIRRILDTVTESIGVEFEISDKTIVVK